MNNWNTRFYLRGQLYEVSRPLCRPTVLEKNKIIMGKLLTYDLSLFFLLGLHISNY